MHISPLPLPGLLLIEPRIFSDARGSFYESFNARQFQEQTGIDVHFVQDNHAHSARGVLRGLHYQVRHPQGKLVRVVRGAVWDVTVDIRRGSPSFGQWHGVELSEANRLQLWVPPGFAHGYSVLSPEAEVLYKTTDYWAPEHERCICWNDPRIGADWKLDTPPVLSEKDRKGMPLAEAEVFP
ncbi:dTDP-4-dehydrorhamnose 3,5-epimerase [Herbaspirillum sp. WKF16]|uniref:dTDP-4-dehydrorhamnose 3,5-epimerase n=1 Tax=Herbaspirillum sp. WKF16 TaxID=3028312 RepID=UPI0023A95E80|nr:dTDP-4-dehydrorhamnose 3,5-epimerase [Herbaspirillum sp. WKF16]WDZ95739.1 dTDP-4-dehydrorhamnose 3,5-epimerase [Herbaspirillum sp. WKF16]